MAAIGTPASKRKARPVSRSRPSIPSNPPTQRIAAAAFPAGRPYPLRLYVGRPPRGIDRVERRYYS